MKKTNVDALKEAGLLSGDLTTEQADIINELTDQEINAVMTAGKKLQKATPAGTSSLYFSF